VIKIIGQIRNVTNARDGGFVIKLDVTENFADEAGELLKSTNKNLSIIIDEAKG
jgi:hypothetical protein